MTSAGVLPARGAHTDEGCAPLPAARGPLSAAVLTALRDGTAVTALPIRTGDAGPAGSTVTDDDLQLTLWVLYELHYRGFIGVGDREWDPDLLALRARLERRWESDLRVLVSAGAAGPLVDAPDGGGRPDRAAVAEAIDAVIAAVDGRSIARHVRRHATPAQVRELLVHRSVYHLKESDPQSWVLARLDGPAKVALAELQYDEYGGGRPDRLHSALFGGALRAAGLDAGYGALVDRVPGSTLALSNAMSLFGLHRRLRGAAMGHLAAFEATSSAPCRDYVRGLRRLGFAEEVVAYFDEHIEADAVHEHLARRDLAGTMVVEDPRLLGDVLLGAAVCVELDRVVADLTLDAWDRGASSLRSEDR